MIFDSHAVAACVAQLENERAVFIGCREELEDTLREFMHNETESMQEIAVALRRQAAELEEEQNGMNALLASMESILDVYKCTEKKICALSEFGSGVKSRIGYLSIRNLVSLELTGLISM